MLGLIISIIVIGLIAGALARLIVPGKQSMGIGMTILLGIVGSFVGGFLGFLLFGADAQDGFFQPAGIIGSLIGAIVVLLIWGAVPGRRGSLMLLGSLLFVPAHLLLGFSSLYPAYAMALLGMPSYLAVAGSCTSVMPPAHR